MPNQTTIQMVGLIFIVIHTDIAHPHEGLRTICCKTNCHLCLPHLIHSVVALSYCIIYLVSKESLNLQSHLCDPASCNISTMISLLPNLGQTRWSETRVPISATRNYWRNTGVFSDLDSESTLHYTVRSGSPSSNPMFFQHSSFTPPLVSHLWPSVTLTKLSRKTEITVKSRHLQSSQVIIISAEVV